MHKLHVGSAAVLAVLAALWTGYLTWPRTLSIQVKPVIPIWQLAEGRQTVKMPGRFVIAEIGRYQDELFAYMMLDYFRGQAALKDSEILLTYENTAHGIEYTIEAHLKDDVLSAVFLLAVATEANVISSSTWRHVTSDALQHLRHQSRAIETAYSLPPRRRLEDLPATEMARYLRLFVRFKSMTDPRIRKRMEPVPHPLTAKEARQLSSDMIAVSTFYSLPVEFFIGIGAMENNFMNIQGDLTHAVWKRQIQKGDLVLQRRRGRVLVWNPASGVWQITRETLRYAHTLYLADSRDYSLLPPHLLPPRQLDLDHLDSSALTTYAGVLFRDLLNRCNGDVATAVGAYNGGIGRPNERYANGVGMVASYARRVIEQSAALNGRPAAGMRFFAAAR